MREQKAVPLYDLENVEQHLKNKMGWSRNDSYGGLVCFPDSCPEDPFPLVTF